jgi:hypothetical protein
VDAIVADVVVVEDEVEARMELQAARVRSPISHTVVTIVTRAKT